MSQHLHGNKKHDDPVHSEEVEVSAPSGDRYYEIKKVEFI